MIAVYSPVVIHPRIHFFSCEIPIGLRLSCLLARYFSDSACCCFASQACILASNRSNGIAPSLSNSSWKSRMSNLSPRVCCALARELGDLELADLVSERLARPDDIAIDFSGHFQFLASRCFFHHEIDGFLPVPMQMVHARVDH